MFHRLIAQEWQSGLTIVSFTIFAIVFLVWLIRAWCMSHQNIERLGKLPLDDDRPISK